jgi:hypothetical protein
MHASPSRPFIATSHPDARPADTERQTAVLALLVQLLMLGAVVSSMTRFSPSERAEVLVPLVLAGALVGFALARSNVGDLSAHVLAFWLAATTSVVWITLRTESIADIVRSRGALLWSSARAALDALARAPEEPLAQEHLLVLIGVLVTLLAYSATWVLHRRGWLGTSLVAPLMLLVLSLRENEERSLLPMGIFLFGAIVLAARQSVVHRQRQVVLLDRIERRHELAAEVDVAAHVE